MRASARHGARDGTRPPSQRCACGRSPPVHNSTVAGRINGAINAHREQGDRGPTHSPGRANKAPRAGDDLLSRCGSCQGSNERPGADKGHVSGSVSAASPAPAPAPGRGRGPTTPLAPLAAACSRLDGCLQRAGGEKESGSRRRAAQRTWRGVCARLSRSVRPAGRRAQHRLACAVCRQQARPNSARQCPQTSALLPPRIAGALPSGSARPPRPRTAAATHRPHSAQHFAGCPVTKHLVPSGRSGCGAGIVGGACKARTASSSRAQLAVPLLAAATPPALSFSMPAVRRSQRSRPLPATPKCPLLPAPRLSCRRPSAPAPAGCTASWRPWRPCWRCASSPRPRSPRCRTYMGRSKGKGRGQVEEGGVHGWASTPGLFARRLRRPARPPPGPPPPPGLQGPRPAGAAPHQGASAMCLRSRAAMKSSQVVTWRRGGSTGGK